MPKRRPPPPVPARPRLAPSPPPSGGEFAAAGASRGARLILIAMMAAYALVFGTIAVVKFQYYLYIDFDLAIFAQATDQALRGSLFSSIRGMHWLGDHVSLVLFVLAPIYLLLRHPLTLLLLQCVALALGALPVFAIARRELGHERVALAWAALYLLHPAIGYTNLFEFHPEVLATATLLATFWALAARRFAFMLLFATLSASCREDVALVILMLGLTALLPGTPRRYGFSLLGLALLSLVLSFGVILPAFASRAAEYGLMYARWGSSLGEVALNVLRDPLGALAALVHTPGDPADSLIKRWYWPHMLGPLLFLPLLSPTTLAAALPVLAEHFLSNRSQQHWMLFQYTALVTPVLVVAGVRGHRNLMRLAPRIGALGAMLRRPRGAERLALGTAGAALGLSLVCNLLYGPLLAQGWIPVPQAVEPKWPGVFDRTQRPHRDRMVAKVPASGGVVAAWEFLARLSSRPDVHSMHHLFTGYYTYSTQRYPVPDGVVAVLADLGDARLAKYVKADTPQRLRALAAGNDLRPVDAAGDLLLLVRSAPDTVELFRAGAPPAAVARRVTYDGQLAFTGVALPEPVATVGGILPIETTWQRVAEADRHFVTQFVLRDAGGRTVFSLVRHLGYLLYPVAVWPADTTVRETYRMIIPGHVPPGEFTLGLRVGWWQQGRVQLAAPDDPTLEAQNLIVDLGRITVVGAPPR